MITSGDRQLISMLPETPTSVPKSHCTFFASLLPASCTFMDPHFQHLVSRIMVQIQKNLDAINAAPHNFILLHG